eukprot:gnl/TRDRNA2_/TRDRNA2_132172_c0_seq2.p1 gnl/TRDRNA2_/TRDRNA2_132172_c0~~gnl/TRDRNA2_/TRDRNA2_132172_c0_seq2.p1  ORF type:complete len:304 (+),score=31.25 gnl/TRDRNA2_/TRDRNA2_132172_c0_seq2:338-1249(+)
MMPVHIPETLNTTWVWWGSMVAVAVFNVIVYMCVKSHMKGESDPSVQRYKRVMGKLALPFVFECAWRSAFPCLYNQRQVLVDVPLSSILVDRSLAAVGEVCWTMQMSLAIEQISADLRRSSGQRCCCCRCSEVAGVAMVLLAIAGEICSYLGTFTTNALFEVFEASCWTTLFAIGAIVSLVLFCRCINVAGAKTAKRFTCLMALNGVIYCPYMVLSNIPMYYHRWKADQAAHKQYLPIFPGIHDALTRRVPTDKWEAWQDDWFWMSVYFSLCVWSAILMMYGPRIQRQSGRSDPRCVDMTPLA